MYVNLQLANYIHIRSLSASICRIWPDFGLHWWPSSCEHIYFQIETICSDNFHLFKFGQLSQLHYYDGSM